MVKSRTSARPDAKRATPFPAARSVEPREPEEDWREGVAMREAVIVAIAGGAAVFSVIASRSGTRTARRS
jgi:hypothetical protein